MKLQNHLGRAALIAISALSIIPLYAADLAISLTPSNYHGYNISCNGAQDGWIDLTITGGVAPFQIDWSNKATTEDISGLAAGYYHVTVSGANGERVQDEITLTQPLALTGELTKSLYPNSYNVSCFDCFNGTLQVTASGGTTPYTYAWDDGPTTAYRSSLGPMEYKVVVTDANGCTKNLLTTLTQPERSDWTMTGNAGTSPATQYFGTADNQDLVFRTNATERMRLLANGTLRIPALGGDEDGLLKSAANGNIGPVLSGAPVPYWRTSGNWLAATSQWLGTKDNRELVIKTNNVERMQVTASGRVGIGTSSPAVKLHVAHTDERGGLSLDQVGAGSNAHSEIRFLKNGTGRWGLGCDMGANGGQDFFLWDESASKNRLRVDSAGRVGIGDVIFGSSSLYKLYVEGGIVSRDVKVTVSSFPDHVFAPSHELMPLAAFRQHLLKERHLPGIPSEAEVTTAGGVEVGDLQVRMLKALEEQALYILQLEERITALEAERTNENGK